jgi:hypothetical protein
MKLKMDEDGRVVLADGKPVYVHDDGKESPFDAAAAVQTLNRTLEESRKYKERAQTAEGTLKNFEGIENPDDARKALQTIKSLDEGQLVAAGKVEEISAKARKAAEESVAAARKAHETDLRKTQAERDRYRTQLHDEKIGGAFARSKFISEKIAVPTDLIRAQFGGRFTVDDDGNILAKGSDGNPIPSRTNFGKNADFEEAIENLVAEYPYRDAILKGSGSSGSGARPTNGGGGGKRTISRSEYDRMPPMDQRSVALDVAKGAAQITD